MTLLLNQLFKLVKLLNSDKGAWSIASGFALGMIAGIVPSNPLIIIALLFLLFFFRINGAAFFLSWAVFALIAFFFDPYFDKLGYWLLTGIPSLQPLYTRWYNLPIVPWTRFNNTIVAGSLAIGVVFFLPMLFVFKGLIERYRTSILVQWTNSKLYKSLKATKLYQLYEKYDSVKGALS